MVSEGESPLGHHCENSALAVVVQLLSNDVGIGEVQATLESGLCTKGCSNK